MTQARLQELLAGFGRLHITVVGDLFLDRWWEVDRSLDEPSVETGLTAYQVTGRRQSAGAAGTVLNNLAALGVGDVQAVSMVGDDGEERCADCAGPADGARRRGGDGTDARGAGRHSAEIPRASDFCRFPRLCR